MVEFPEIGEDDDKLGLEAGLLGVESNVHRVRFAGTDTGLVTNSIGVLYKLLLELPGVALVNISYR